MKIKTKDKIKQSLTEMLESAPIDDITATGLCEHAGVNRATFYYHYNSVQDVLTEIETQMESEFSHFLSQTTMSSDGTPEKSFYVMFFEFVARHAAVCKMLLAAQRQSDFFKRAVEAGRDKVVSVMTQLFPACPTAKIDYYYIFVANGFIGLMRYWLNSGMRESVNELAEIGEQVSYSGVKYLQ